ncbi:MAG: hypothetical protein KZQ76_13400 [Candidatus Thiodiazotropha sp. (ex Epidulcina cf. delphinae)]|nr:hypothetical protein [Candidatus Thiodiazotropha sp. (ex Epidulcina cf. delphinae)]
MMAFEGRIYKVLHTYEPANQVTLKDLQRHLQKKYGRPRELSSFPAYVRNMAGKIGVIRRGDGELKYIWQLPGESWRVELGWTRKPGISIAYLVNELDMKQREAKTEGL